MPEIDSPEPVNLPTRELLLRAAGEVFAEVGFRDATVRQICQRAGTNVAAVNYHFGDKERLYLAVLRYAYQLVAQAYPYEMWEPPEAPPERRLRAFVRSLFYRMFGQGPQAWEGRLFAREMIDPTRALSVVVDEQIRPMAAYLRPLVQELLGPGAAPELARLCGCSVVSQCVFYQHCRSVVCRLFPEQGYDHPAIERMVEHVTHFSLAALRVLGQHARGSAPGTVREAVSLAAGQPEEPPAGGEWGGEGAEVAKEPRGDERAVGQ